MDIFALIAVAWLVSVAVAAGIGRARGFGDDAANLAVFLGPLSLPLLLWGLGSQNGKRAGPTTLPIAPHLDARQAKASPKLPVRRAG